MATLTITLLFLILLTAVCCLAFSLYSRTPRRHSASVCGKCQYPVAGLTTFTCPECGSDLRTVGILAANHARPMPLWLKCTLWSIAVPGSGWVLTMLLMLYAGPMHSVMSMAVKLTPMSGSLPGTIDAIGHTDRVLWTRSSRIDSFDDPMQSLTLHFVPAQGPPPAQSLTINLTSLVGSSNGGQTADPTLSSKVSAWLVQCNFNLTAQDLKTISDDISRVIDFEFLATGQRSLSGGTVMPGAPSYGGSTTSPPWVWMPVSVFWLCVCAWGCYRIHNKPGPEATIS